MADRCVVGVDLGGTNVRASVFDESGTPVLLEPVEQSSHAQTGTAGIIEAIARTVQQAIRESGREPEAIGMAVPGHVDNHAGVVRWSPNFGESVNGVFMCWRDQPLREPLSHYLSLPIVMGNDANLAALGEYRFGSGGGDARCLVMLTLGTGIGGGVVMGPQAVFGKAEGPLMLVGGNGGGAELGHSMVMAGGLDCNAGSYGAVEAYCQRDAIIMRAIHRLQRGRPSIMPDLVEGDLSKITPRIISLAAEQGDALARQIWQEIGTYLGVCIGSMINIFAPDVVAIGGQIAKAGPWLMDPARTSAADTAIPSLFQDARIVTAELIEHAGMYGGAAMALEALKWNR